MSLGGEAARGSIERSESPRRPLQGQTHRHGPVSRRLAAVEIAHDGAVDAEHRAGRLDRNRQNGMQDPQQLRIAAFSAAASDLQRPLTAEGDRVISQAKRNFPREVFHHAAGGVENGETNRIGAICRRPGSTIAGAAREPRRNRMSSFRLTAELKSAPPISIALKKLMSLPLPMSTCVQRVPTSTRTWTSCSSSRRRTKRSTVRYKAHGSTSSESSDQAGVVELFDEAIHIGVLGREDDDFLADVGALADFPGDEKINVRFLGIERESLAGLELDDGCQFPRRHRRQAEVLDMDDMPRQRHNGGSPGEIAALQKLLDRLVGLGRDQFRGVGRAHRANRRLRASAGPRRGRPISRRAPPVAASSRCRGRCPRRWAGFAVDSIETYPMASG